MWHFSVSKVFFCSFVPLGRGVRPPKRFEPINNPPYCFKFWCVLCTGLKPVRTVSTSVSYYTYNIVYIHTYVHFYIYTFEVECRAGGRFRGIQLHVPLRRARRVLFFSVSYAPEWRLFIYGIIRRFDVVVRLPAYAYGQTARNVPCASPLTRSDRKWSVARTR